MASDGLEMREDQRDDGTPLTEQDPLKPTAGKPLCLVLHV